jgi:hypothetical protein
VLTKLKYEIYHDGINGLKSIRALIEMTNFSAKLSNAETLIITQSFGYIHYWSKENKTSPVDHRSGNPGYLTGKPVRAGQLAHKDPEMLKEDSTMSTLTQSDLFIDRGQDELTQFMTMLAPGLTHDCGSTSRY